MILTPLVLLDKNYESFEGLGYAKLISSPNSIITYNDQSIISGDYIVGNNDGRPHAIEATLGTQRVTGVDQILILSPIEYTIVVGYPKKGYFKTINNLYSNTTRLVADRSIRSAGLYATNNNLIEVKLVINDNFKMLRSITNDTLTPLKKGSSDFSIDNSGLFNIDILIQPNEVVKLLGWSNRSDISLLAPYLDYLNDDRRNENSLVLSSYTKSTYYKESDIPEEYYGVHAEVIDNFSNNIYRVISPVDSSGLIILGSKVNSINLRSYLPINTYA